MSFIEQRYQVACVVPLTVHSFITALTEHHTQHKVCKKCYIHNTMYYRHYMIVAKKWNILIFLF